MATLFKEVNYNLTTLVENIDLGIIGLPDIQRPFVWPDIKVRRLFDSMYRGFPVGYLLFWQNALVEGSKEIGIGAKQKHPSLLIVDGQQRLTSLYAVLKGKKVIRENFDEERIIIAFRPTDESFEIPDATIRKSSEYVQDISELWSSETDITDFIINFIEKLKTVREVPDEERKRIQQAIGKLYNLLHYPFSALELSPAIDEEQVAEIFVRINSEGKNLNQADFILTLMSVFWDEGRKQLEQFTKECKLPSTGEASPFNYIITPSPDQMLRVSVGLAFKRARLQYVYSILRGKDLDTGEMSTERRDAQFERLRIAQDKCLHLTHWHEYLKVVEVAGYIRSDIISSENNLLYCYVMFLLGKVEFGLSIQQLRGLISRWFFMSSLTGRYTGSPESQMETDLARFRELKTSDEFRHELERVIETEFTNDYWVINLPEALATSAARGPSLFAYYAALNILDAKGLFSELNVRDLLRAGLKSNRSALEKHHLFPKAYLRSIGVDQKQKTNQIANYALVEWSDNGDISDQPPAEYISHYLDRMPETSRASQYHWHALWDGWEQESFDTFLGERRKRMALIIKEAYNRLPK